MEHNTCKRLVLLRVATILYTLCVGALLSNLTTMGNNVFTIAAAGVIAMVIFLPFVSEMIEEAE